MAAGIKLFESPGLTSLDFLWGWIESEVYKRRMGRRDESFPRILDVAASVKKREDHLRRTTRDLRTRAAKCTEADGGIY